MSRIAVLSTAAVVLIAPVPAGAKDYAATARNIIPSGQLGGLPVPADAGVQAQMYDAPTKQVDRVILRNSLEALGAAGRDGTALLHDVDVYVQGLNARLRHDKSTQKPWTRVDVFAANALAGQIFGQGGGDEARRSEILSGLRKSLGATRGQEAFDDLSERD